MNHSALAKIARKGHRDIQSSVRQGDCDGRYRSAKSTSNSCLRSPHKLKCFGNPEKVYLVPLKIPVSILTIPFT